MRSVPPPTSSSDHVALAQLKQAFARAMKAHQAGHLDQAERCYRLIVESGARHPDASHNLGAVLAQRDQHVLSLPHFKAALEAAPERHQFWLSYVEALLRAARPAMARSVLAQGMSRGLAGVATDALVERLAGLLPQDGDAQRLWGVLLFERARLAEAERALRHALQINPLDALAHHHLAWTLKDLGRLPEAEASSRAALQHAPDWADALNSLGNIVFDQGRLIEAEQCYRRAIEVLPTYAAAHNNLGNALNEQCRVMEAIDSYRSAVTLKPDYEGAWSNLLFALNYHPDLDAPAIFSVYQEWAAGREPAPNTPGQAAVMPSPCPATMAAAGRRIKVGYVSPDFCAHSCVHFLEPLLAQHDKSRVEVYAYAELRQEDAVTQRYRQHVDHWRATRGLSDAALAKQIQADGIDVLVDVAGHTAGNRLGVFALKPAPVSVSWLGFGYTTGLRAIDYFLTDAVSAPPGCEDLFSERLWRLPVGWVYRPGQGMGEPGPLPALKRGYLTFGTLSRAIRINRHSVRVWSEILQRVDGAHLMIDSLSFRAASAQDTLAQQFAGHGIARDRLHIGCHSPPWDTLRQIDIGLDCFPHNCGTTLFESLYMGVPFVTLAGRPSVGRLGSAVLTGAGRPQWIALTENDYIEKVVALASDVARLDRVRSGLRTKLCRSALMNEPDFVRSVESAYRQMLCAAG